MYSPSKGKKSKGEGKTSLGFWLRSCDTAKIVTNTSCLRLPVLERCWESRATPADVFKGLEPKRCEERLRDWSSSPWSRGLREDLTAVYNDPTGRNSKDWARVFLKMHGDRIRGNRPKALGELKGRGCKWATGSFLNQCRQTFSLDQSPGLRRTRRT